MIRPSSDGLVAYSGGGVSGGDFMALELVDGGLLRLSAGGGHGQGHGEVGPAAVMSGAGSLIDGRWHTVDIALQQVCDIVVKIISL